MTLPTVRQLFFLCLFWLLGCWSTTDASPYNQWEDGIELRKVRSIQSDDFNDILWRDQDEEHVKNVFKRFLFHYSKARNSVGAVQQESHSAHPLMRLLPKLSQRRKKVLLLVRKLKIDIMYLNCKIIQYLRVIQHFEMYTDSHYRFCGRLTFF
uniref:Neuromedin-S n=1 Tax=Lates calcarifer TaxID=8187 RepID=A0A4W6DMY5_LATCA